MRNRIAYVQSHEYPSDSNAILRFRRRWSKKSKKYNQIGHIRVAFIYGIAFYGRYRNAVNTAISKLVSYGMKIGN